MRLWRFSYLALLAAILGACSGGREVSTPAVLPPAASVPNLGIQSFALTGRPQTLPLAANNACAGRVTLPFATVAPGTSMTVGTSLLAPVGVKLQPAALRPAAGRLSFLCYVTLSVSNTVAYSSLPGFTVTVAPTISTASPQQFFYAVSDPTVTNVQLTFDTEGPATVNGQTLTFAPAANPLTLLAGRNYIFAFYATSLPSRPATRLYVVNGASNSVSVFDVAHAYAPLPPITAGGLHLPFGVTIDDSGILYVANDDGSRHHSVSVFDTLHGNAPLPRITGNELTASGTFSIAVDTRSRLYATTDAGVVVIDTLHGNAQLPTITGDGLLAPTGVAVDRSGKLYVANASGGFHSGPSFITIFDTLNGNKPLPSVSDGNYLEESSLAIDSNSKLYAANFSNYNSVSVYDTLHGNAELPYFYVVCVQPGGTGDLCGAPIDGLAIDPSGKLYVAVSAVDIYSVQINEVLVFDTAHGNVQLPTLTGNGLNGPGGVAVY